MPATKPKTTDEYIAALSNDKRAALEVLRKAIRAAAPTSEECISYQLPSSVSTVNFLSLTGLQKIIARSTPDL